MNVILTTHHKTNCVDLRAMFKDEFRLEHEEAYEAEDPKYRAHEEAWLTIIPGKLGWVFPWGGRILAAYTKSPSARRALEQHPKVVVKQGGTIGDLVCPEAILAFDVELIYEVADILRLKRRRKISPEARIAAIERLAKYQFKKQFKIGEKKDE